MKALTIKEIKERCESDDKIDFKGIVEKVFDFNDKPTEHKIGYQNIIVKDKTDKIKVIFTIWKNKDELYDSSIEGKEVEVSGKVSIYKDQANIFGKLKFKEELKPKELKSPKGIQSGVLTAPGLSELTPQEIRIKCLEFAQKLLKLDNPGTKELIEAAEIFEGYVCKTGATIKMQHTRGEKTEKKNKEEKTEKKSEGEKPKGKLTSEQIKKVNTLMALVENRGEEGKEIINEITERNNYQSIKEFNEADIKEASGRLDQIGTEEIPF